MLGTGLYCFTKPLMEAWRETILDDVRGKAVAEEVRKLSAKGCEVGEVQYKRVPRGLPADHPRADLLKHGGITTGQSGPIPPELFGPGLIDYCLEKFRPTLGLHKLLLDMVMRVKA